MSSFKDFEREVITILVADVLPEGQLRAVIDSAKLVSFERTGVGYFLEVRHRALPAERVICDEPLLVGKAGGVECGFVVFLEDGRLTLECHAWGEESLPENFRERMVTVRRIN